MTEKLAFHRTSGTRWSPCYLYFQHRRVTDKPLRGARGTSLLTNQQHPRKAFRNGHLRFTPDAHGSPVCL